MGLFFKRNYKQRNTSDNNISINTNTDIMYKIGQDLGEIKTTMLGNTDKLNKIEKQLKNHNKRLEDLEREINFKKNHKNF